MSEPQFYDVMVDIETTGLSPDHAAILQIAAVKFDLKTRTIDTSSMFDRCLLIPPGRFWDEGTRSWWGQQKRSVLHGIYDRAEDPGPVCQAFADWVGYEMCSRRFWAKPTTFDFPFVDSYFKQFGIESPFHFRIACDVNSYIRGLARDPELNFHIEFTGGDAHNALYDVIHQINMLFTAEDIYGKKPETENPG